MAEMTSDVDYKLTFDGYGKDAEKAAQGRWNGLFHVDWHFIKDVPNKSLSHIINPEDGKSIVRARGGTEVPLEQGRQVVAAFLAHKGKVSLLSGPSRSEKEKERKAAAAMAAAASTHSNMKPAKTTTTAAAASSNMKPSNLKAAPSAAAAGDKSKKKVLSRREAQLAANGQL
jgi:hypothetical protein